MAYLESLVDAEHPDTDQSGAGVFSRALRIASMVIDLSNGNSEVFGWGPDGELLEQETFLANLKEEAERSGLMGDKAPKVLAKLLNQVQLPEIDDLKLIQALSFASDAVHFWGQADNGEEQLAQSSGFTDALLRIAKHIVESPATSWWYEPWTDDEQWIVRAISSTSVNTNLALPPRTLQEHESIALLVQHTFDQVEAEESARRTRQNDPDQRFGGTWWSFPPYRLEKTTSMISGIGPVGLYCEEDSRGEEIKIAWKTQSTSRKIFEVNSAADWARLCAWYPVDVTATRLNMWELNNGRKGRWVIPDWLKVANDFDGVHLSAAAYIKLAGTAIPVPDLGTPGEWASSITGWSPDWTFYFVPLTLDADTRQVWHLDELALATPLWLLKREVEEAASEVERLDR